MAPRTWDPANRERRIVIRRYRHARERNATDSHFCLCKDRRYRFSQPFWNFAWRSEKTTQKTSRTEIKSCSCALGKLREIRKVCAVFFYVYGFGIFFSSRKSELENLVETFCWLITSQKSFKWIKDFREKSKGCRNKNFLNGKNIIEIFLWKENRQIRIYYIDWIIGRKFVDFENFIIARSRNYSTETCYSN